MDFNFNGANGTSTDNSNTLAALPLLSQLQQQYQALVKGYGQSQNNSSLSTEQQQHSLFNLPQFQNSGLAAAVPSFDQASIMASNNNASQSGNNNNQDYMMGDDDKDDMKDDMGMDGELDRNGQHHPIAEFLYQLTKMLTDDNSEIIEWADGRIKVHYPERLEGEVLHKYFRHSKFASFQRQLNYFGFRKIAGKGKMSPCSYVNDGATSDIRSLLLIKRKTNGSAARKAAMQQRAVALANNALNPLLNFPGAAAALAGNPAALASLSNPQALSGAMALLSDNALRAGLLQHAGLAGGNSPQLNLLLQQQQQLHQAHANSLFGLGGGGGLGNKLDDNNGMGGFPSPAPQPPQQQLQQQNSNNGMQQHMDHSQIAQQTQQLQQLQQQLQQLQQQQRQQQHQQNQQLQQQNQQQQNKAPGSSPQLGGASAALNASNFSSLQKDAGDATKTASSQFEQFLAARLASASQGSNPFGSIGSASAALKQLQGGGSDNPASAALQQQLSSMPASAAGAASAAADQSQASSNNLFESALNLKSLLQEHQAAATAQEAQHQAAHAAQHARGLMNRLPSSNTIFPSVASFGNLLNSSNRLSSLLSLSSFVGGPGNGGNELGREQSLADLAAAIHPGNVSSAPLSAAFAAFQQQHNSASAAANQFRIDN